jgi:hypothetical protein
VTETKDEKAVRYLAEGRLTVEKVGEGGRFRIMATCRGSDGDYQLGYDAEQKRWGCTCEANATFHRRCSHLIALQLVTKKPTT